MGDHFSKQASTYKKFRPTYPKELFEYMSGLCKEHGLAWDCATGSGQAAIDIAEYFNRVIATDLSAKQLEQASIHPKIQYQVPSRSPQISLRVGPIATRFLQRIWPRQQDRSEIFDGVYPDIHD